MNIKPADRLVLIVLLMVGLVFHLVRLDYPRQVIFDEVHFGKFVSAYCCTHERFFDIHPPHAKLVIAAAAALAGYNGQFSFEHIGQMYGQVPIVAFRLIPALAGTFLPLIIYILLRQAGGRRLVAVLGAGAVVFDNALVLQTRVIALDGILLVAQFGALAAFWAGRKRIGSKQWWFFAVAGALAGLAVGTKFTGLLAVALLGLLFIYEWWQAPRQWQRLGLQALLVFGVAALVYGAGWWLHYQLLTLPGSGDAWQVPTGGWLADVKVMHDKMLSANYNLTATHPYSSVAWTWPFMMRPVFYWQGGGGYLYFLGNPVVWWGSGLGLVLLVASGITTLVKRRRINILHSSGWVFLAGYVLSYGPLLRVPRALFLYHYLTPLLFSLLLTLLYLDRVLQPMPEKKQHQYLGVIGSLIVIGFILFSPYTFGFPIGEGWHTLLYWFPGWR